MICEHYVIIIFFTLEMIPLIIAILGFILIINIVVTISAVIVANVLLILVIMIITVIVIIVNNHITILHLLKVEYCGKLIIFHILIQMVNLLHSMFYIHSIS